jgi:hypothetical protein
MFSTFFNKSNILMSLVQLYSCKLMYYQAINRLQRKTKSRLISKPTAHPFRNSARLGWAQIKSRQTQSTSAGARIKIQAHGALTNCSALAQFISDYDLIIKGWCRSAGGDTNHTAGAARITLARTH